MRRHHDRAGDDLIAELLHLLHHVEWQEVAIALVGHKPDAILGEPELVDTAGEVMRDRVLDDVDDRELCPDGACLGVLGPDRRCKVCGALRANQ